MTDNDIRRVLDAAAPHDPGFDGWGDKVRKGHRRRRTAISAVAALGLVALAVPTALQLTSLGHTPIQATPSPTPTVTSSDPTATRTSDPTPTPASSPSATAPPSATTSGLVSKACLDSVGVVTKLPDGKLPAGATRVWLCDGDQEPAVRVYGPPEPLTSRVDEVVAAFNALPVVPDQECGSGDYQQAYTLVVEYPQGKPLILSGITHGCKTLTDGVQLRGQADTFFSNTVELFKQQRAEQTYELDPGNETLCLQGRSFMGMTLEASVRGFMCGVPEGSTSMFVDPIQRDLPADLVSRIVETARAEATKPPPTEGPAWSQSIVLLSRYGDPITLYRSGDTFSWMEGTTWWEWTPKADLLTAINEHTTGMLSGLPPVSSGWDPCDGDSFPAEGSITRATSAVLCVHSEDGTTRNIAMPDHLLTVMVKGIAANVDKVAPKNNDVTGDAIRLPVGQSGAMFFVGINKDGDLVWSDYMLKETAWQPTPEFRQWLVDNGVPLGG